MQKIRSIVWAVMFQGQKDLTYMQIYASVKTHAGRRLMANHIRGETLWVYTVFGTTYWITRAKIVPTCHGCEARVEKTHGSSAIWGVPTYDRPLFSALTLRGWYMLLDVRGRESCCGLRGRGGDKVRYIMLIFRRPRYVDICTVNTVATDWYLGKLSSCRFDTMLLALPRGLLEGEMPSLRPTFTTPVCE
jgi:hypothetical protein